MDNRKRRPTKQRKRQRIKNMIKFGIVVLIGLSFIFVGYRVYHSFFSNTYKEKTGEEIDDGRPNMDVQLLDVNPYSRPGIKTGRIRGIVMHYTANPGSTAMQNRDYFNGLKDSHETKASSHFIIGLEGEIVQAIPTWEEAYASNNRNSDTVSIECCHPNADGTFQEATYKSMVELTAWLCAKFELTEQDVIRHYDITGKNCPKYFVENESAWEKFKEDVKVELERT